MTSKDLKYSHKWSIKMTILSSLHSLVVPNQYKLQKDEKHLKVSYGAFLLRTFIIKLL